LLEALSALGDWDAARDFLPVARRIVPGNALLGPMADRVEGLIALSGGDAARAARSLRRAAEGFRRLKVPFEEARTREALAAAAPARAEAHRRAALEIYDRLGAQPAARSLRRPVASGRADRVQLP